MSSLVKKRTWISLKNSTRFLTAGLSVSKISVCFPARLWSLSCISKKRTINKHLSMYSPPNLPKLKHGSSHKRTFRALTRPALSSALKAAKISQSNIRTKREQGETGRVQKIWSSKTETGAEIGEIKAVLLLCVAHLRSPPPPLPLSRDEKLQRENPRRGVTSGNREAWSREMRWIFIPGNCRRQKN